MNKTVINRRLSFLLAIPLALLLVFGLASSNVANAATARISPGSQTACVGQNVNWTLYGGTIPNYSYTFSWGDNGGFHRITSSSSTPGGPHAFANTQSYGQYLTVTDGNNTTAHAQSTVNVNCFAPK